MIMGSRARRLRALQIAELGRLARASAARAARRGPPLPAGAGPGAGSECGGARAGTAAREPPLWRQIAEDVACVRSRDPAARHLVEIVTTYPGVHAVILHRLAHRLWRGGLKYAARLVSWAARLVANVDIHPGARIGRRFFIDHGAGVVVGETAVIGDDVTLYHGVTLGGTSWTPGKRHPTLGDGVLVGAGAKILGPVEVGAGARVGANSVVIADVPAGMTVVGVPGRLVAAARAGRPRADGRIDLEHHRLPDPLGAALVALAARIERLETRLAAAPAPAAEPSDPT
ncbi:serine O-acetyltransferase [Methylobacterium sp. WSM2598]|uniref:serine O-acetyltransferase n=1 Tax=Methylobacterium sp. WSM2598 TaxID=398261 RepID=UPI00037F9316|nr:serine O-acetyltransferase [Methylobacterium sp. WSM2598]